MQGPEGVSLDTPDTLQWLRSRVRSIKSDPLHSHAYLGDLKAYLDKPTVSAQKSSSAYAPPPQDLTFAYVYNLSQPARSPPLAYQKAADFKLQLAQSENSIQESKIIFFTGYPSPEWLDAVLSASSPGFHFIHRHLDFMSSGQRDWHIASDLPSRSSHMIRIIIPSVIFIGPEGRHLAPQELHHARQQCISRIRQKSKSFYGASSILPGSSIVRNILIHSGDNAVLEQTVTVRILKHGQHTNGQFHVHLAIPLPCLLVLVFIWSDAGSECDNNHLVAPDVDAFQSVKAFVTFCPVFFDSPHGQMNRADHEENCQIGTRQPLAVLPSRFCETLSWPKLAHDPILCLGELFGFQCAATKQYMNMMRKHINQLISRTDPTGGGDLNMEHILNFDYSKTVLVKFAAHLHDLHERLTPNLTSCPIPIGPQDDDRISMLSLIRRDLSHLHEDAKTLIELCDAGKSAVLSSFSITESRRAAKEAKLVTALTKATNRVTFIFLPISFVTSVFGMNFKQFGQGPLSIWLWVQVTLPLLIACIVIVEYGTAIRKGLKNVSS